MASEFSINSNRFRFSINNRFRSNSIFIFHKNKYSLKYLEEISSYKIRRKQLMERSEIQLKLLLRMCI